MKTVNARIALFALAAGLTAAVGGASMAQAPRQLGGVVCSTPPPVHCPDAGCPGAVTSDPGNAVEPKTGRKYFLDYPCDMKPNEKVTVVLALHGGGSSGNWQRHYFPLMDLKEKYRLVIATPTGSNAGWNPTLDDEYLRNIVDIVYREVGAQNVKAFWLAGHSLGGQTSNRLLVQPFFREKLTGWVSLSGGRLGSKREEVRATIPAQGGGRAGPPGTPAAAPAAGRAGPPPGAPPGGGRGGLAADASILPEFAFSHIYSSGEHELTAAGLPPESKWAQKLGCRAQTRGADIVDSKAGYVFDGRASNANPNPIWGRNPRPGSAKVFTYPSCTGGKVVADIIRVDKGHTEGLEPKVTEEIVKMMMAAR